jgi:pyruvate kinase
MDSTDRSFGDIEQILKDSETVSSDDLVVKIASMPIGEKGFTNMLKIVTID